MTNSLKIYIILLKLSKGGKSLKKEVKRNPVGRPTISNEIKSLVVDLYLQDMKCNDIAKACKISRASVFNIIKEKCKD